MLDISAKLCSVLWNETCAHDRSLIFWCVPALQVALRVIQYGSLVGEESGTWGTLQCSGVSGLQGRLPPKLENKSGLINLPWT